MDWAVGNEGTAKPRRPATAVRIPRAGGERRPSRKVNKSTALAAPQRQYLLKYK